MRGRRGNEMIIVGVTDNNQRITGVAWDGSNWNALPQNPLSTAVGNDYWPYAYQGVVSSSGEMVRRSSIKSGTVVLGTKRRLSQPIPIMAALIHTG